MREIKFRGKSAMEIGEMDRIGLKHNNGWVYGNLVMCGKQPYIVGDFIEVDEEYTINEYWCPVHAESLGQFTGLKDKNGIEIYEGDIVTNDLYRSEGAVFECYFDSKESAFKLIPVIPRSDGKKERNEDLALQMSSVVDKEVIGNVYEDPELLEVKNNE